MKLVSIVRTPNKRKEFIATFALDNGKNKVVRFGTNSNYVLNKNKTVKDRVNYRKRHRANERWSNPLTPGSLSRYILWGESRSLQKNISAFKSRFKL